jgi:hypothetical protein
LSGFDLLRSCSGVMRPRSCDDEEPLLDVDKANEDLPPGGIAIQVPEDPSTGKTSNTNEVSWGLCWPPDGAREEVAYRGAGRAPVNSS